MAEGTGPAARRVRPRAGDIAALALLGLAAGALAGWVALLRADGAAAVADVAGDWYVLLAAAIPVGLLLLLRNDETRIQPIHTGVGSVLLLAGAGLVVATLLFVGAVTQVAQLFGGEDGPAVAENLYSAIGWWRIVVVAAVVLAAAALPVRRS